MLTIKDLVTTFQVKDHTITAVDHVSLSIPKGKTIGLVGESGSGKSVTALSIMRLLSANAHSSGEVHWDDRNLLDLSEKEMRHIRGRDIGLIFQNPLSALNPVFSIGNQFIETIRLHHGCTKIEAKERTISLLKKVNIPDPETRIKDYPHQFSMGMCQRLVIAITLAMEPTLLIADEPTASLDVTVQAQIMALLGSLSNEYGMSMLFISHDLGLVAQHCDYIYIMYLGAIVEEGPTHDIFTSPKHPYTQALIASIPVADPSLGPIKPPLSGDIPSPMNLPTGCRFHTRCPQAMPHCKTTVPPVVTIGDSQVACLLYEGESYNP